MSVQSPAGGETPAAGRSDGLARFAAPGFVLLWSTGFIGAKLGLPYAEPMTFLAVRFLIVSALLAAWLAATGAFRTGFWPRRDQIVWAAIAGVLIHGGYLGGVFAAIALGVEAWVSAAIVGLQPIALAAFAWAFLGERLDRAQMVGFALGVAGVSLIVARKLVAGLGSLEGLALCVFALVAFALGAIVQKRFCTDIPMRRGALVQYLAAAAAVGVFSLAIETREIVWSADFVIALTWLTLVLSIGAILLLYTLLQRGAASEVASLFFLVPPSTAVIAWVMFGETLGAIEIVALAASALGVWLVLRGGARR